MTIHISNSVIDGVYYDRTRRRQTVKSTSNAEKSLCTAYSCRTGSHGSAAAGSTDGSGYGTGWNASYAHGSFDAAGDAYGSVYDGGAPVDPSMAQGGGMPPMPMDPNMAAQGGMPPQGAGMPPQQGAGMPPQQGAQQPIQIVPGPVDPSTGQPIPIDAETGMIVLDPANGVEWI